jgi:hypothetical protein
MSSVLNAMAVYPHTDNNLSLFSTDISLYKLIIPHYIVSSPFINFRVSPKLKFSICSLKLSASCRRLRQVLDFDLLSL